MDIMNTPGGSKVANCLIVPRSGEENLVVETTHGDGSVFVNLDGYLICPREKVTDEQLRVLFTEWDKYKDTLPKWEPPVPRTEPVFHDWTSDRS